MNEKEIGVLLELLTGLYIQSLRNYDMLSIIAAKLGADAVELTKIHKNGKILCPDPALFIDDEE